ncbi:unnamed protein product [Brassica oleracea]
MPVHICFVHACPSTHVKHKNRNHGSILVDVVILDSIHIHYHRSEGAYGGSRAHGEGYGSSSGEGGHSSVMDVVQLETEVAANIVAHNHTKRDHIRIRSLLVIKRWNLCASQLSGCSLNAEELAISKLGLPRPPRISEMLVEELDANEKQAFLNWRRMFVRLEENEKLVLTPFEKNLDIWRQLWQVLERSDLMEVRSTDGSFLGDSNRPKLIVHVHMANGNRTSGSPYWVSSQVPLAYHRVVQNGIEPFLLCIIVMTKHVTSTSVLRVQFSGLE